jgi:hypothetical protein
MKCNGVQLSSLELGSITLHLTHDMDVLLDTARAGGRLALMRRTYNTMTSETPSHLASGQRPRKLKVVVRYREAQVDAA